MTYGLKLWDAAGNVVLDTSTVTARLIDTFDAAAGVSDSRSDARYAGAMVFASAKNAVFFHMGPHRVTLSGTTVYYTAQDSLTESRIFVVAKS